MINALVVAVVVDALTDAVNVTGELVVVGVLVIGVVVVVVDVGVVTVAAVVLVGEIDVLDEGALVI